MGIKYYRNNLSGDINVPEVKYDCYDRTNWIDTNGLVLYLDAGNSKSYPGSGTSWTGLSGLSNNGTLVNGVGYNSANGGSLSFDGVDDYVTLSSSQIAPGTGAFTWNFWVRHIPTGGGVGRYSILLSGTGSNTVYGVVYMNSDTGLGYYALGNRILDSDPSFDDKWWHIAFVGNGGLSGSRTLKLYRNGVQAGSTYTYNYNFTSTTPLIGANHSSFAELMRGNISNVSYYNRALSAAEISQNYNALRSRFGIESIVTTGLVLNLDAGNTASYPGTGTTWTDLSGLSNNGTLTNGPTYNSANGGSLVFDGVDDYINLNFAFTQSSSANSYTIVMGAKLSTTSSARRQLWGSDNAGYDWGFGAGDGTRFTIFSGENIYTGRTQDTNWHIFTAQWSSSFGTRLYIDNVLDISTTNIDYDSSISATTSIGRNPGFGEYWNGNVSFVQLYNRALTAQEIQQNYNALRGRFGI